MGLLAECKYCLQYVSSKYLDDHIRQAHPKEFFKSQKKGQRPLFAKKSAPKLVTLAKPATVTNPKAAKAIASKPMAEKDSRVVQAEQEQRARRFRQAASNKAIDAFVKKDTLKSLNSVPLNSVWKEQVAKLAPIKKSLSGQSDHLVHLQSVPTRTVKLSRPAKQKAPLRNLEVEKVPGDKRATQRPGISKNTPAKNQVSVLCSCGGENERCYRCYGTGYFEVNAAQAAQMTVKHSDTIGTHAERLASFASDARGGHYGVRENGQFTSVPISDDYGEDSSS